jgi:dTDP-4-amino-4,6-dideoxygalactose transaminase
MLSCSNPQAQYQAHREEIDAAIRRVLDGGWYILGQEVRAFEAEFATYIGGEQGIGVGSGTEALHLALVACGVGPGDEVITVAHTAVATVSAIGLCGATPVFVDIEPDYFTLDAGRLESAITPKTRAIVPVHLYGQAADLNPILDIARRHDVRVVEDCAQAHGARYHNRRVGALGDVGCFSFYPTKNLGALGDGGMVVTHDTTLAKKIRMLREYGWEERYVSQIAGWNSRLDEIQAAILRVKLRHLDADNEARSRLAAHYDELLGGTAVTLPQRRTQATHVFHQYVVRSAQRDALRTYLKSQGVGALIHYPLPIHLQPAYQQVHVAPGALAHTERAAHEILSLPMYPDLGTQEVRAVAEAILQFAGSGR